MNTKNYQKASQFLDAELRHEELENLLQQIKQYPEIKKTMTRYQIASHALGTEESATVIVVNENFLDKINQQLKQEPHYLLSKQKHKKNRFGTWQKTSAALAASVAIVAFMVSRQADLQNSVTPQQAIVVAKKPVAEHREQSVNNEQSLNPGLSQHERLKAYLQAHSDDLYTYGSLKTHPYGQVASFGQE